MTTIELSPAEALAGVRDRFKRHRLARNLTQAGLAERAGVTLPSLRRFERTGLIAFDSLLKLALVLECLGDFERVGQDESRPFGSKSLDQLLAEKAVRKKGRIR